MLTDLGRPWAASTKTAVQVSKWDKKDRPRCPTCAALRIPTVTHNTMNKSVISNTRSFGLRPQDDRNGGLSQQ